MELSDFPKPGDICQGCIDIHKDDPKILQKVGSTINHSIIVALCPYCDGERALEIYAASQAED